MMRFVIKLNFSMFRDWVFRVLGFLFLLVSMSTLEAQDLHYSQFYNSPHNLNPSLTGMFDGNQRYILSGRDQWRYVPVPWTTVSASFDRRPAGADNMNIFLTWGLNINYDKQGDSKLTLIDFGGQLAFHNKVSQKSQLSLGLGLGYATKGFDTQSLTWDKQWDGEGFNTSLPSGEQYQNTERIHFLETKAGLNYRYRKSYRTWIDLGVSAIHLLEPEANFSNVEIEKLPRRYTANAVWNQMMSSSFDIQLHGLFQLQDRYDETVFGALVKLYLDEKKGNELAFHFGLGYRTSGSWIPTLAVAFNEWYLGFNLDVDRTAFNTAVNSSRGGYELHLSYIISKVRPMKYKNCSFI